MAKIANKTKHDNGVTFAFIDSESVTCDMADLPTDIVQALAVHGLSQKLGDSYASAESVEEARSAMVAVWDNLLAGNWNAKVSRGGKLVEAMVRALGKTYEECMTVFQGMDDDAKKELRKHPQIKLAMAEIEMERQTKAAQASSEGGTDLGALFE